MKKGLQNEAEIDAKIIQSGFWPAMGPADVDFDYFLVAFGTHAQGSRCHAGGWAPGRQTFGGGRRYAGRQLADDKFSVRFSDGDLASLLVGFRSIWTAVWVTFSLIFLPFRHRVFDQ